MKRAVVLIAALLFSSPAGADVIVDWNNQVFVAPTLAAVMRFAAPR